MAKRPESTQPRHREFSFVGQNVLKAVVPEPGEDRQPSVLKQPSQLNVITKLRRYEIDGIAYQIGLNRFFSIRRSVYLVALLTKIDMDHDPTTKNMVSMQVSHAKK